MADKKKLALEGFACFKNEIVKAFSRNKIKEQKNAKESENARKKGNALYALKRHTASSHKEIFVNYCKSIALAPIASEALAMAYGNRSAFLAFHLKKYKEGIEDIDRALAITNSDDLKIKLLCRKVECMKHLGLENYQTFLEAAQSIVDSDEKNKSLMKFVEKAKGSVQKKVEESVDVTAVDDPNSKEYNIKKAKINNYNSISIEYNKEQGRHMVAKEDINPGEIIFVEDLFCKVLTQNKRYTHCNYCMKTAWTGIPCDHCSWAMFCSEKCKELAWRNFHDVECSVLPHVELDDSYYMEEIDLVLRMFVISNNAEEN